MRFEDFAFDKGVLVRGYVPDDNKPHRFGTREKPKSKNGWVVLHAGAKSGVCGDWQDPGVSYFWQEAGSKPYTAVQIQKLRDTARKAIEADHKEGAAAAKRTWDTAKLTGGSEYFTKKQITPTGDIRFHGEDIIIPIYDKDNQLITVQRIRPDGTKRFTTKAKKAGGHFKIPGKGKIIICEGYATGCSIHYATGYTIIVALDAGNIPKVAEYIEADMIACDNDKLGISEKYAKQTDIPYVMPNTVGDDFNDLACAGEDITNYFMPITAAFSFADYLNDRSPIPDDLISPRVLTPNGMLVLGGAPKVGKSDFLMSMLAHMAAGLPFMGMTPPRPLRIFYLQSEIDYDYLRERIQSLDIQREYLGIVGKNLYMTPQTRMILDANGVERTVNAINKYFPDGVDIIAIDPLRNVFDGESENDNAQMMQFLQNRVEVIRNATCRNAGIIIAHHTKKITGEALIADPFQGLSGASSLRGYYTAGIILYRPDDNKSERVVTYELRNGPRVADKFIDKLDGRWCELDKESSRLVAQHYGAKLDAERFRKRDVIIDILMEEANKGNTYEVTQFCEKFEGKEGLGASTSIRNRINVLLTTGYIKYCKSNTTKAKSHGILVTEGMILHEGGVDKILLPTHYKSPSTGAVIEERYPETWLYD